MKRISFLAAGLCLALSGYAAYAKDIPRDNFFWPGQINKATDIIHTDGGLLTKEEGYAFAKGIQKVIDEGNKKGGHTYVSSTMPQKRNPGILNSYNDARKVYIAAGKEGPHLPKEFPMTEQEWREAKDPVAIIRNRVVKGGPQPEELAKMIRMAQAAPKQDELWKFEKENPLKAAEKRLNSDFEGMLAGE
ncbi:MAG: hypothetical protein SPI25_05955 [Dialister sp.]|nr:hypothetical protein [Dialister sp.]